MKVARSKKKPSVDFHNTVIDGAADIFPPELVQIDPKGYRVAYVDGWRNLDPDRLRVEPGYQLLALVLDGALAQAQHGKGKERHGSTGDKFEEQIIVALNEKIGSIHGQVYQACKKAVEATRLPYESARRDLLGAINYLAAAVIQLDRQAEKTKDTAG